MAAIDPNGPDYAQQGEVANFVDTLVVSYPIGVEEPAYPRYSQYTSAFTGVNPYPVDVLIDKKGIIRYVAREYDPVAIDAMIKQLLAE